MNRAQIAELRNRGFQTGFFLAIVVIAVWSVNRSNDNVLKAQRSFNQSQVLINQKIVASQLQGCKTRGRALRAQVNYDTALFRKFMLAAVKATRAKPDKASQKRAAEYQKIADHLKLVKQPNCAAVIYRPGGK